MTPTANAHTHAAHQHPVRRRIISGILVVVPLVITWKIVEILKNLLGGILMPVTKTLFKWLADGLVGSPKTGEELSSWHKFAENEFAMWAISIIALVALIYIMGAVAGHVMGRRWIKWVESWVARIPLISSIYSATRKVIETILISDGVSFKSVVLVEFPRNGAHSLGFVTGNLENAGRKLQKVFVPTSPNPTSGFLIIVPLHECIQTTLSVEEGISYIVSAGILGIDDLDKIIKPDEEQPKDPAVAKKEAKEKKKKEAGEGKEGKEGKSEHPNDKHADPNTGLALKK